MIPTLDTIQLPEHLYWQDEIWSPVEQSAEYNTDGSMDVQVSTKQAGRPITLAGADDRAWVSRETLLDLLAFASVAGKQMTYTHSDEREFTVMFRFDEKPVSADPVFFIDPPEDTDWYCNLIIRLMEVS
jgi:hypothetical protein